MCTAAVNELDGRTRVVDEHLPGAMDLAHRALQAHRIAAVPFTELAVAVGGLLRMSGDVFLPEQHEDHAFAPQFLVDAAVLGQRIVGRSVQAAVHVVPLQSRLAHRRDGVPVQACGGLADVLGDDALGRAQDRPRSAHGRGELETRID
jgi:hypothetical protein